MLPLVTKWATPRCPSSVIRPRKVHPPITRLTFRGGPEPLLVGHSWPSCLLGAGATPQEPDAVSDGGRRVRGPRGRGRRGRAGTRESVPHAPGVGAMSRGRGGIPLPCGPQQTRFPPLKSNDWAHASSAVAAASAGISWGGGWELVRLGFLASAASAPPVQAAAATAAWAVEESGDEALHLRGPSGVCVRLRCHEVRRNPSFRVDCGIH